MGMYTGIHVEFELKPDTPEVLLYFFNLLFGNFESDEFTLENPRIVEAVEMLFAGDEEWLYTSYEASLEGFFDDLVGQTHHVSCSQELFNSQAVIGERRYRSFASSKNGSLGFLKRMFINLFPYLVAKDGDILVRTIYECWNREEVIWVDLSSRLVCTGPGFQYTDDYNDSRCPNNTEEGDENFIPIMNWYELKALGLLAKTECEYFVVGEAPSGASPDIKLLSSCKQ